MNTKKGAVVLAIAGSIVALPLLTSALSIQDIQAQIQALMSRITALQAEPASTVSIDVNPIAQHRVCVALYRNLSRGSRGDDVMSLQEFLRAEGYLSANATGYFGPATRAALARWQASQGVSAVGSLGPITRARISAWCGGGPSRDGAQGGALNASPASGAAPLAVNFSYQPATESGQYYIEFGDGQAQLMTLQQIYCIRAPCISPHVASHTYVAPGTYTASVSVYIACLYTNPRCMMAQPRPLAQVTIVVRSGATNPGDDPQCKSWYDGCNSCSRGYPGGPAACTLMYCATPGRAYCTAWFDSPANKPPVISSFSGPTSLSANQTGMWSVQASDPENGPLSYHVVWGDEQYAAPMASMAAEAFVQTTTFTHAYARAGTYTVVVHVRDSAGQEAQTTATLRVEGTPQYCTMEYAPVCGQKTNCPACYYSEPACLMPCSVEYKTYGNRCLMNADNATLVHEGACQNPPYQP